MPHAYNKIRIHAIWATKYRMPFLLADIENSIHLKWSSSHYINQNNLRGEKFSWQTGYAAFSVSASEVEKIFQYIKKQNEHHRKKTYNQEYET